MARDIKLAFDGISILSGSDIEYKNGDLVREEGLVTAVLISLYTDRRASKDDEIDNQNDKRGWWGDLAPETGDRIGSKLWQYERSTSSQSNITKIKQAIENCLQWMIDDGVAKKIIVSLEKFGEAGNYRLGAAISIYKSDGTETTVKFDDLWEATYAIQ